VKDAIERSWRGLLPHANAVPESDQALLAGKAGNLRDARRSGAMRDSFLIKAASNK
jgi:hypothetical protein